MTPAVVVVRMRHIGMSGVVMPHVLVDRVMGGNDRFELHTRLRDGAKHAGGQCAPEREQHGQQEQQPHAECLHSP